jgi:hypothetical protein
MFRVVKKEIKEDVFSSHDFIGKFSKIHESEWKKLLTQYETNAVQKVNSYIGRLLSLYSNDLHIRRKEELKPSKNAHASISRVHFWEKIK